MAVIKLGDLATFEGDASGSWLVMNDPTNTATYKVQREQLMSGSTVLSASYALSATSASYALSTISASYALTASVVNNQNLEIDTWATSSDGGHLYFPFKFNNDSKGPGTVTLTNGSNSVVGNSTNFLDTGFAGLSYWYNLILRDSTGTWYVILTYAPSSNTSVLIYEVFSRTDVINGFLNQSARASTWTGASGTYDYWIVRNFSDGPFSNSVGNRSYSQNYGFALGGSNVARSGFAAGFSNLVVSPGDNSSAVLGLYNISSGSFTFALGTYTQATGIGSFAGGGFYGTNYRFRQRFVTNLRRLISSATASFNFSGNNDSQTSGHGALSDYSAILGGINHNVPSTSPRSAIIGGNSIKADASRPDTVYVPNLQVTGSSFVRGALTVTGSTTLQSVTASNVLTTGTITAQTLVVQTITSSIDFVTGSTRFGTLLTDTHQFTGSVSITGSLNATSSWANNAITASYVQLAQTASFIATASWAVRAVSASMVSSASFLNLIDTPKAYSGYSGSVLVVSSSELGLTFAQTALFDILDFGAKNFTELLDAPDSYLGQADKVLVVSSSEAGLQFRGTSVINSSDFGVKTFVELTDAPDNYIAKSGFLVAVSSSETGLEFVPTASLSFTDFGYKQFIQMEDTPSTYSGKGGFIVAVSASANALEFIPTASFDSSSFGYKQFIELTDTPSTYSGNQGFLVSVSASALEFVPTASLTGYFPIGMQDMYVGADQMYPTFVSGCADITRSYLAPATINTLDFDSGSEENAQYAFSFPRTWDNSPIQTKVYWTVSGSQSGSVVWGIKAAAYSNAFSLTASFSTEYLVSSSITGSSINISPYTAYIMPSGFIQTGSLIIINVARKVNNANDNLDADAKMIGISIKYATNRATAE